MWQRTCRKLGRIAAAVWALRAVRPRWPRPTQWVEAIRSWRDRARAPATRSTGLRKTLVRLLRGGGRAIDSEQLPGGPGVRMLRLAEQPAPTDVPSDPLLAEFAADLARLRIRAAASAAALVADAARRLGRDGALGVTAILSGSRRAGAGLYPQSPSRSEKADEPWEAIVVHAAYARPNRA